MPGGEAWCSTSHRGLPTNTGTLMLAPAPRRAARAPDCSGDSGPPAGAGLAGAAAQPRQLPRRSPPRAAPLGLLEVAMPSAALLGEPGEMMPGPAVAGCASLQPPALLQPSPNRGTIAQPAENSFRVTPSSPRSTKITSTTAARAPPLPPLGAGAPPPAPTPMLLQVPLLPPLPQLLLPSLRLPSAARVCRYRLKSRWRWNPRLLQQLGRQARCLGVEQTSGNLLEEERSGLTSRSLSEEQRSPFYATDSGGLSYACVRTPCCGACHTTLGRYARCCQRSSRRRGPTG